MAEDVTEIEFNSMVSILERLSKITYLINDARARVDTEALMGHLVDYYKEISADLNNTEKEIWKEIKRANKYRVSGRKSQRWILEQLNELDLKLRDLAKKHGYLTKNIKKTKLKIV